jgi:hypothetical protein
MGTFPLLLKLFDGTVSPPRFLRKHLYRAKCAAALGPAWPWLEGKRVKRIDIPAFKP